MQDVKLKVLSLVILQGRKKGRAMLPGFMQNHSKHVQEDERNQCRTELDAGSNGVSRSADPPG